MGTAVCASSQSVFHTRMAALRNLGIILLLCCCTTSVWCLFGYPWHASCRVKWAFSSPCSQVSTRLVAQMVVWEGPSLCPMAPTPSCPELPCGQRCLYTVVETRPDQVTAEHQTPVARYVDDLTFKFTDSNAGCRVEAFSTSRTWDAVLDKGTNSCKLRNVVDGSGLSEENGFTELTSNSKCTEYDKRD